MNLSAYDKISGPPTKTIIYNSNNYPYIVTREVKKRKYYCYVTRYEPNTNEYNIFLVLLDDKPTDRCVAKVRMDNYGRFKFNLSRIKSVINIKENKSIGVNLSLETEADDGDIYKIDLI